MVCGQRPFRGLYDQALVYEIMHEEPEPLTGLRTGIPIELELLVNKCLAKNAGQIGRLQAEWAPYSCASSARDYGFGIVVPR